MAKRNVLIACPAKPGTQLGNRVTALRWQRHLRALGHRVKITTDSLTSCDLLIALHANRSANLIADSKQTAPNRPIVVGITGTDLYRDCTLPATQQSLTFADRIIVLQPEAKRMLTPQQKNKSRVIYQSIEPVQVQRPHNPRQLRVIVAGHLRPVKDPFRAAMAVRKLPADSRIVVHHYGATLTEAMHRRATDECVNNARYAYRGEIPRGELRRRLASCWLMVLSSKSEGGANVLGEAIVNHTPVLASRIDGSVGLLGADYDGYFEFGKTKALQELLLRCERERDFYQHLVAQVEGQAALFEPSREREAWHRVLVDLL